MALDTTRFRVWNATDSTNFMYMDANSGANVRHVDSNGDIGLAGGSVFIDKSSNRLGLGTTTPTEEIHITVPFQECYMMMRLEET